MKIGIYKPYKKVFFNDDREDLSAVSYEVVNVAQIFADRGHRVSMLSETDLPSVNHPRVDQKNALDTDEFDRILLFSGSFQKDKYGDNIFNILRRKTPNLAFVLTDLRLLPQNLVKLNLLDHAYTQATKNLQILPHDLRQSYCGASEFYCFGLKSKTLSHQLKKKDIRYAFMGTERGRLADVTEYCNREGCLWIGKSKTFGFDTRVDRNEFKDLLDRTKYSITICDEEYNKNHFITPRPYEHYHHDIVNFVDHRVDPDSHHEPKDSWFRVKNYQELREKMNELDDDQVKYLHRIFEQRKRIKREFINGEYVYQKMR